MAEIVICAESSVTRAGLAAIANSGADQVVAEVGSLSALGTWLQGQRADLVVVALTMLGAAAEIISLIEAFSEEEDLVVLVLLDDAHIADGGLRPWVIQMMALGTVSILPMSVSGQQLRDAIASIGQGLLIFHPDITEAVFSKPYLLPVDAEVEPTTTLSEPLTPREIQILNQLAGGLTNKAIAQALTISEHTVKFHISAILSKLNVSSRTEAVAVGIRHGLVML